MVPISANLWIQRYNYKLFTLTKLIAKKYFILCILKTISIPQNDDDIQIIYTQSPLYTILNYFLHPLTFSDKIPKKKK